MYVCVCNSVTDSQIRKACDNGAKSIQCLQDKLKVATCCGRCKDCAKKLIHESMNNQISQNEALAAAF